MKRLPLRISILYFILGVVWITFSDRLLAWLIQDHTLILQTSKNWVFILISTFVLYWALTRNIRQVAREQASRQASESWQRKLIQAVENSGDIVFITNRQGVIEYVNPTFETVTGYCKSEAIGQTPRLLQSGNMPQEFYREVFQNLAEGRTFRGEFINRKKNGELFVYDQTITPVTNEQGEITHFVSTGKDITARKKLEDALKESEANLRRAQAVAHIGSWSLDLQHNRLAWTEETYHMFGLPVGTPLNYETFLSLVHPEDRSFVAQSWEAALRGAPYQIDHRILVSGQVKWVHEQAEIDFDESGAPIRAIGTVQDVTETRRRLYELESLWQLSQAITQQLEFRPRLLSMIEAILHAFPSADKSAFLLADAEGNLRVYAVHKNNTPPALGVSASLDSPYWSRVFREHRSFIIDNVDLDPEYSDPVEDKETEKVKSAIVVPFSRSRESSGIVVLESVGHPGAFSEDDLRLLETMTSFSVMAMENARLFEETTRRLKHIQSLRRIDMAITGSLDLRVTLNVALDEITEQLAIDAAAILLFDPHTLTLDFAAGRGFRTQALQHTHLHLGESYAGRAALERRIIFVQDLRKHRTDFLRSPFFSQENFISYYAIPLIAKGQVKGVLEIFHRSLLSKSQEWDNFLETLAGQTAIAIADAALFQELEQANLALLQAYDATIEGWSRALDLRDKETEGHTQRVTELTLRLARAMGITNSDLVHIRRGALLHDIGKMGVPDAILLKPGPLTEEEWGIMRKHPQFAYEMLAPIDYLRPALDIPYGHHEKWDGTGYPRALKGNQIPLAARIFAVIDVFDALTSDRPYRKRWTQEMALNYIHEQAGKHFDPEVVQKFLELMGFH
jgi:PAS domain S-box-containing protein/putative nucleotidyltransferase with HDIG domain